MTALSLDQLEAASLRAPREARHRLVLHAFRFVEPELGREQAATLMLTAAGVLDWPHQRRQRRQMAWRLVREHRTPLEELAQALLHWAASGRRGAWIHAALQHPRAVALAAAAAGRPEVVLGRVVAHRAAEVAALITRLAVDIVKRCD